MNEKIDYAAIGHRLREIRKSRGLNVSGAAKLTGINTAVISALELSDKRNPGLSSLITFANAYDCGLDEIVFGEARPASTALSAPAPMDETVSTVDTVDRAVDDPYYKSLRELTEQMDDAEKDFMLRLISTAHSEFGFVRNRMQ